MKFKMKNALLITGLAWLLLTFFSACNPDKPENAPQVSRINTLLEDRSNYPYNGATAFRIYEVYLENPEEYSDINKLQITDSTGTYWYWEDEDLEEKWNAERETFSFYCYSSSRPHNIPLGTYTASLYKTGAEETVFEFDVYARGDLNSTSGSVYTSYDGKTPQILKPPTDCSALLNGNTLDISFTTDDEIITDALVWYYDSNDEYLGGSGWLSNFTPVVTNGSNAYSLDVSGYPAIDNVYILLFSYNYVETNISYYRSRSVRLLITSL